MLYFRNKRGVLISNTLFTFDLKHPVYIHTQGVPVKPPKYAFRTSKQTKIFLMYTRKRFVQKIFTS